MQSWIKLVVGGLFIVSRADAQDNPKSLLFDKDERTFFVPMNYSPIRTVRLRFHPSEPKLLAQVSDKRLAVWDLNAKPQATKGQKEPRVLPDYACEQAEGWITGFDVHPSGKWVITGGSDRQLRRWAWKDAKPLQVIAGHDGWIEAVTYSPDGKFVATGGADLKVKIWDAESLKLLDQFSGHSRFVRDLAWTPKGEFLCTGGEDGKVLVYDVPGKKVARTLTFGNTNEVQGQIPSHSGVYRLECSNDGNWLSVTGQGKFGLYHLPTGKLAASENLSFDTCCYPAGQFLLVGYNDTKVFRLNPAKLEKVSLDTLGKKGTSNSPAGDVIASLKRNDGFGMAVRRDGALVAAAVGESTVGLWKVVRK